MCNFKCVSYLIKLQNFVFLKLVEQGQRLAHICNGNATVDQVDFLTKLSLYKSYLEARRKERENSELSLPLLICRSGISVV